MRWKAIFCFSFLATIGCHRPERPPLDMKKLVEVLVDIHLAEAAMQNLTISVKDSIATRYYQQIYTIHGVKEEDFDSAFTFVKQRPKLMAKVYERVVEELNKKKIKSDN